MAAERLLDATAQARFGVATTITIVSTAAVAGCIGDDEPKEEMVDLRTPEPLLAPFPKAIQKLQAQNQCLLEEIVSLSM